MTEASFYGDRADLYDRIYHWKDYESESNQLAEILQERGVPDGARVLEAACGTGSFLVPLSRRYSVAGLDRSPQMVDFARRKLPDADLRVADMADFRVDRSFDALLCLFSSIGYLLTEEALRGAAGCFAAALRPGGCLLVEPWIAPEEWRAGSTHVDTAEDEHGCIARVASSAREGDRSVVEFQWAEARPGGGVGGFRERHEMWLCPRETQQSVFEDAGFEVEWRANGLEGPRARGLWVGRRG